MRREFLQLSDLRARASGNSLTTLTNHQLVYLRDGEVVLYKRERSRVWQMRYRLFDKQWHRVSTKHHNIDYAIRVAGDIYDEARFRERLGLAPTPRKFKAIAKVCLEDLSNEIATGIKPMT